MTNEAVENWLVDAVEDWKKRNVCSHCQMPGELYQTNIAIDGEVKVNGLICSECFQKVLPCRSAERTDVMTPEANDELFHDLHGSRERLCRAQVRLGDTHRAQLEQAITRIDRVGVFYFPKRWSRHDSPPMPGGEEKIIEVALLEKLEQIASHVENHLGPNAHRSCPQCLGALREIAGLL